MSYLVMECRRSYAVLLDQEGRFVKAANLRYEVGQTVFDPVLLEEPAPKLKLLPWIGGGAAGLAALAAALVFAVILPLYHQAVDVYSSIYLTINPQVQMDLNHAGDVVELTGTNGDGVLLLEGYDYTGKDRLTVADELVDRAIDMGFLEDGGTVNFSIDTPEESLFQEYGMELRDEVTHHLEGRVAVEVQVVHGLAGLLAAVGDHPEIGDAQFLRHLRDDLKGVGHHGGIFRRNLPAGCNVGLGNHQEMGGRLGDDVVKGVHQLVLVNLVGGDLPRRDFAKQTIAHAISSFSADLTLV